MVLAVVAILLASPVAAQPQAPVAVSRLKDVTTLQGAASQPLIGYGLVVGLNKTGDRRQTIFSAQTLANMLERFGVAVPPGGIKIENVAAVMVTAEIGPYAQSGTRLDITASSIGDARSLQGGTLLPTPLRGPDGSIVALGQGPLSIGGFGVGSGGNAVLVNHLTVGRVPGGGLIQVARATAMAPTDELRLALRDPDFVSAGRIARAINMELGADRARVSDAGTVVVRVPTEYRSTLPDLIARLAHDRLVTVLPLPPYECHGTQELVDGIHWSDSVAARVGTTVVTDVLSALAEPADLQRVLGPR